MKSASGVAATTAILSALVLISFYTDRLLMLTTPGRLGWLIALITGKSPAPAGQTEEETSTRFQRFFEKT